MPDPARAADPGVTPEPSSPEVVSAGTLDGELRRLLGRPGGLTAQVAARRAAASSPDVKQSAAEVRGAKADKDQAAAGYVPRVSLTARYTRLSEVAAGSLGGGALVATTQPGPVLPGQPLVGVDLSFPQILDQYLLQANVTVPLTDYFLRTNHANTAAEHSLRAAQYRAEAAKRAAALQAQLTYYAWAQSALAEVVAKRTLDQAKAHHQVAQVALRAGALTRGELLRFDAQQASAELLLERARTNKELNADALRTLLHDGPSVRYQIGEDLFGPLPPPSSLSQAKLERIAQRKRPEFAALTQARRGVSAQRRSVQASRLPRLDAFGNAYYANPHQRSFPQQDEWSASWDVGVQLTYVLSDLPAANASSRSLSAKRSALLAEEAALKDNLRREISVATRTAKEAEFALKISERGLSASEAAYQAVLLQFRAGAAKSVDLIDANTELLRARLDLLTAHINRRVARARLAHASGEPMLRGARPRR